MPGGGVIRMAADGGVQHYAQGIAALVVILDGNVCVLANPTQFDAVNDRFPPGLSAREYRAAHEWSLQHLRGDWRTGALALSMTSEDLDHFAADFPAMEQIIDTFRDAHTDGGNLGLRLRVEQGLAADGAIRASYEGRPDEVVVTIWMPPMFDLHRMDEGGWVSHPIG